MKQLTIDEINSLNAEVDIDDEQIKEDTRREKLRLSQLGTVKWNKGKSLTEEHRQKLCGREPLVTQKMRDVAAEKSSKYIYVSDKGVFDNKRSFADSYPEYTPERLCKWAAHNKNGFSRKLKDGNTID